MFGRVSCAILGALLGSCSGQPLDSVPSTSESSDSGSPETGPGDESETGDETDSDSGEDSEADSGDETGSGETGSPVDPLADRCFDELQQYVGTSAPDDLLVDSLTEVHCEAGANACYEQIAIYDDGTVVYQNLLFSGGSKACVHLDTWSPPQVANLQVFVDQAFDGELVPVPGGCSPDDPQAADFGVDVYRGRAEPGFVKTWLDQITNCTGIEGAELVKQQVDALWAVAPREIDFD